MDAWLSGAAIADVERALKDARETGQAATLAYALTHASISHLLCGSYAVTQRKANRFLLVDGFEALLQPSMQNFPFIGRYDPRDDVKRDQSFLAFGLPIDRKRHSDAPEQQFGFAPALGQDVG